MDHFPIAMSNNQMVNTSNNMVWDGCVLKWGKPQYASKIWILNTENDDQRVDLGTWM